MVVVAEQREVVDVGPSVGFPGPDVVGVREGRIRAAREPAVPVAAPAPPGAGRRSARSGPALVHGVAHVVIDGDDDGGVAGDSPDGLGAEEAAALEVARQRGLVVDQGPEGDVGHHEPGARPTVPDERTTCRNASHIRWSHGVSPSEGIRRARASRHALTSAYGAGGSWMLTVRSRSLQRSVLRSSSRCAVPSSVRRGGAGQVGELPYRALGRPLAEVMVGLGRGHVDDGAHLVEAELACAQRRRQLGEVEQPPGHVWPGPGGRAPTSRSARRPRPRGTSPPRPAMPRAGRARPGAPRDVPPALPICRAVSAADSISASLGSAASADAPSSPFPTPADPGARGRGGGHRRGTVAPPAPVRHRHQLPVERLRLASHWSRLK